MSDQPINEGSVERGGQAESADGGTTRRERPLDPPVQRAPSIATMLRKYLFIDDGPADSGVRPDGHVDPVARVAYLRNRIDRIIRVRRYMIASGLVLLAFSFLFGWQTKWSSPYLMLAGYGAVALVAGVSLSTRGPDSELRDIDYQKQLQGLSENSAERRAEVLFRQEQDHLSRYYDQTLSQGRWIFTTGLTCIALGFVIIGFTLWLVARNEPGQKIEEKILTAVLGAVGSILTNFVSVLFLNMYAATVANLGEFHNRLLGTHYLHFANVMSWKLPDAKREEAIMSIIQTSLRSSKSPVMEPSAVSKPGNSGAP